ncbi:AAA family ATPase [Dankookia sp. GCM10030260]|uniref:AAA family ATPase n=1 Tax=Dankookia sp. GCM10030260 TaxID=3273390 RepID=UPI0036098225
MLLDSVDRAQFGWYLKNALLSEPANLFGCVLRWHYRVAGVARPPEDKPASGDDEDLVPAPGTDRYAELHATVAGRLERFTVPQASGGPFERNIAHAVAAFGLTTLDIAILQFVNRCYGQFDLKTFVNLAFQKLDDIPRTVAAMLGVPPSEVEARLMPAAPLRDCGLLMVEDSPHILIGNSCGLWIPEPIRRRLGRDYGDGGELAAAIIGRECQSALEWQDFAHLGEAAEVAARVLKAAVAARETGVHVLLFGPPGTGKTEFAAALADRAGLRLFAAGEADDYGNEPSRHDRLAAVRASQAMLRSFGNAAVLLDEAEDVLEGRRSYGQNRDEISKAFMNRTLEVAAVPIIWTCNAVGWMDPATLRRMAMVIEVTVPDTAARQRIWTRVLERETVVLDAEAPARLARRWAAPAAAAASAARAARLAGGGEATVETALTGVMAVIGRTVPDDAERDEGKARFDPALTVCTEDLCALCATLARPEAPRGWSLCLSGPPGTGKSAFARYLAVRLGLPVLQKRASDLLSMWVGGSEQAIAAAFAEARSRNALLLIDEAEALLFDRGAAQRAFEVSQVDEMLTWMERHPLPLVCTTNLPERMDRAVPRRFTLKLRFEALDPARAVLAFRRLFGAEPPRQLPEGLTPGDFSVVRQKAALLGMQDPEHLVQWLEEEAAAKGEARAPIGFRAMAPEPRTTVRAA